MRITSCLLCLCAAYSAGDSAANLSRPLYSYVGCYDALSQGRHNAHLMFPFSTDQCFRVCKGYKQRYVGLNLPNQTCYCTSELPESQAAELVSCQPCPQDPQERSCGGPNLLSLYESIGVTLEDTTKNVDVLIARDHGIDLYSSKDREYRTLARPPATVAALDFHFRRNEVYAAWNNHLYSFPLTGAEPGKEESYTLVTDLSQCMTFAIDWVHDRVYWPICGSIAYILMMDLGGGYDYTPTYHLTDATADKDGRAWVKDMVVDPYKGLLFWLTESALMSCQLDGKGLTSILPHKISGGSFLALDLSSERLYFDSHPPWKIASVKYGVPSHQESLQVVTLLYQHELRGLGAFKSDVYYALVDDKDHNSSVKVMGRSPTGLLVIDQVVTHMRLVHSELQAPGRTDACTTKGCSHHCRLEGTVAECRCLFGYPLQKDGLHCNMGDRDSDSVVLLVLFSAATLLAVVTAAGLLMCVCDKVWSAAHRRVVRITDNLDRPTFSRMAVNCDETI